MTRDVTTNQLTSKPIYSTILRQGKENMYKWDVYWFEWSHRRKHETLVAHPGFEGCPGGAEEANISQHHRDLDSIPGCGAPGSVGHSGYFALQHFRTQKWTALGPIGALLLCEHGACLWLWPLLIPWHILVRMELGRAARCQIMISFLPGWWYLWASAVRGCQIKT